MSLCCISFVKLYVAASVCCIQVWNAPGRLKDEGCRAAATAAAGCICFLLNHRCKETSCLIILHSMCRCELLMGQYYFAQPWLHISLLQLEKRGHSWSATCGEGCRWRLADASIARRHVAERRSPKVHTGSCRLDGQGREERAAAPLHVLGERECQALINPVDRESHAGSTAREVQHATNDVILHISAAFDPSLAHQGAGMDE